MSSASIAADTAIVVGINEYPAFSSSDQLQGAVPDSNLMAEKLKQAGFASPILLQNSEATKAGITRAFADAAKACTSKDRFVFYFAGHGWRNTSVPGHAALVPNDATSSPNTPEITVEELAALIQSVPANSRSIILDSCFSGAMTGARSFGIRARSLQHPASKNGGTTGVRDLRRKLTKLTDDSRTTFYCACGPEQLAYERSVSANSVRGLFSMTLEAAFTQQPTTWGQIGASVNDVVSTRSRGLQVPTLYPATANPHTFLGETGSDPSPTDPSVTYEKLWQQFSLSAPNPAVLEMLPDPDQTIIRVGDQFRLKITVSQPGYLLLLNQGTSGSYYVQFPSKVSKSASAVASACAISPGSSLVLPDSQNSYEPDAAGVERLKAILFTDRAEFMKVAEALAATASEDSLIGTDSRDLKIKPTHVVPGETVYTADLQVTIESPGFSAGTPWIQSFRTGWIPATKEQVKAADRLELKSRGLLPKRVLLTEYLPPVASQGAQGSCVAWATGYYMYSWALNQGRKLPPAKLGEPAFQVSPAFIYNQINGGKDQGSYIADAVSLLVSKGAASLAEMPYTDTNYTSPPGPEAFEKADFDKAIDRFLIGTDSKFSVDEVKRYLAEVQVPVVFGITVHDSFMKMPSSPGFVYSGPSGPGDPAVGGHAMCVVGYDDDLNAFRVVNSWGTDWGDGGFCWISCDYMGAEARDDWTVLPGGLRARDLARSKSFKIVRAKSGGRKL